MITKLALSPLLALQAVQVRRRALLLPEPEGPRAGALGHGAPLKLLILGDSSAAGVGASHQSKALSYLLPAALAAQLQGRQIRWTLIAKTGATSASTLAYMQQRAPERFDLAVIALGVNDVTRLTRPRAFEAQQRTLHAVLRERFGLRHILRSALPPMGQFPLLPQPLRAVLGRDAARLSARLEQLCAEEDGTSFAPLDIPFEPRFVARDGFHPSEAAYALWAERLAERLAAQVTAF